MIGTRLSHYLIEEKIGEGGMGVVYKAQDTRLLRHVAIKILPAHLVSQDRNRERLVQEARAASALNHPNICTVHDIGEANGVHFIVMELLEGQTLREILEARGRLPEDEVIEMAAKVCDALTAAHNKGIIHRDIKPDNIMVTREGVVKVMDFGLAKLVSETAETEIGKSRGNWVTEEMSNWMVSNLPPAYIATLSGLLGTVSYMSPEQIRQELIDHRSDIFSLGVVLYELAYGQLPFQGTSKIKIMKSILTDIPKMKLNGKCPLSNHTAKVITIALNKRPLERFQSADSFARAIVKAKSAKAVKFRNLVLSLSMVVIIVVAWNNLVRKEGQNKTLNEETRPNFTNARTLPVTSWPGEEDRPSFSPDGGRLAFVSDRGGNMDIWVKNLKTGEVTNITSDSFNKESFPGWSPDGKMIVYQSNSKSPALFIQNLESKKRRLLIEKASTPKWSPDGKYISYLGMDSINKDLFIAYMAGAEPKLIFKSKSESYIHIPTWTHDSEWLIFSIGSQESHKIIAKSVQSNDSFLVVDEGYLNKEPIWCKNPEGIYYRSNKGGLRDIWFQRISLEEKRPTGDPVQITNGANIEALDISLDGRMLAYSKIEKRGNIHALQLDPVKGKQRGELRAVTEWNLWTSDPDISPDGQKIAFCSPFYGYRDLFVCDSFGNARKVLHRSASSTDYPAWSPDGTRIAYIDGHAPAMELWLLNVENGKKVRLTDNDFSELQPDWSPDGKWIVFGRKNPEGDIWVLPSNGGKARQLTFDVTSAIGPRFSPDGKTIAFTARGDGYENVWLIPFAGGEAKQITFGKELGGTGVCWSPDGRFLYYCPMVNGVRNIWKISLDGKYREQLTLYNRPSKQVARMTRLSIYENELFFANFERVRDIWLMEQQ